MTGADPRRALIVDDDAQNRYLLRALMQGHGWAIDEAHDGAEALVRAAAHPPDLVVSDLLMPVMDGYTLLRRWRQDAQLQRIPFVVYTATYTEPKDERLAVALGADAFVIKPAEPEAFMARVLAVLADADRGARAAPALSPDMAGLLADYNEVLLRKLEKRSAQLERTNKELLDQIAQGRRKEEEIRRLNADLERRVSERTAQLSAAQAQAEAANVAKSAFLANMSHEIRTPMNAIIGLTHLMARDSADPLQRDRLAKVDAAAHHLLQVINDILDLSKIDAGKMTLVEAEFSLDQTLSQAFEMVSTAAQDKGLELVLDLDHVPDRLRGDPTRLNQAVINLLSNAVKFTDTGWVRLRSTVLASEADRLQIRIEVQDTGPGIEPAQQDQLFKPFEQLDASSGRRHAGTGLGLALTRHLARLMGGDIGVDSRPGQGSRFWFTAWLHRGASPGDAPAFTLRGLRALLVDDLPESLEALGAGLQHLGVVVDPQASGAAGLQALQQAAAAGRAHDVVLIDWRMPGLDGLETMRQARALLGDLTPPGILVSAFDVEAIRHQAHAAGFGALLVKPVTASSLVDALAQVLRRRPLAAAAARPQDAGAAERLRQAHAGQRVLLVEDNAVNREVAEELLRGAGLAVDVATNGQDACTMALSRQHALILMDVQMPGMDGLAAARQIRRQVPQRVPIVAMTANAFSEDRQACLDAGMDDHVAKPVDPDLLYLTLLRWLPPAVSGPAPGVAPDQVPAPAPGPVPGPAAGPAPAAPTSLPPSLSARLATVQGLDLGRALRHMGGRQGVLQAALRRFVETYRHGVAAFGAAPPAAAHQALAHWQAASHSLLGACGAIGAQALCQQLLDFQRALAAPAAPADLPGLATRARALQDELLDLVGRLDQALAG